MPLIIMLSLFLIPLLFCSPEKITVVLYKDDSPRSLNISQTDRLNKNSIEYLKTCRKYESVTGKTYNHQKAKERLDKLKLGNYLKITFAEGISEQSMSHEKKKIDEMFVGIDDRGFPDLITIYNGQVQLYLKCSGSIAIRNFVCDKTFNELFNFRKDEKICEMIKNN